MSGFQKGLRNILIIVSVFLIGILSVFVIFLIIGRLSNVPEEGSNERGVISHEYQFLRVNPITNEQEVGNVYLPQLLGHDEFLSYSDDDRDLVLVSNFGQNEYLCKGTCYCETDEGRRSSYSAVGRKTIFHLVAAFSSLLALQHAKDYFDDECMSTSSDTCTHVHSEVEECDEAEVKDLLDKYDDLESDDGADVNKESIIGKYVCKGYCIVNEALTPDIKTTFQRQVFDKLEKPMTMMEFCSTLVIGTVQDLTRDLLEELKINEEQMRGIEAAGRGPSEIISTLFAINSLDKYCRTTSIVKQLKTRQLQGVDTPGHLDEAILCAGVNRNEQGVIRHQLTRCKKAS